jgi:hypothetical protein
MNYKSRKRYVYRDPTEAERVKEGRSSEIICDTYLSILINDKWIEDKTPVSEPISHTLDVHKMLLAAEKKDKLEKYEKKLAELAAVFKLEMEDFDARLEKRTGV